MTEEPPFRRQSRQPSAEPDFSDEVCRVIDRQPGDHVRCTFVGNSNYRCNWWAPQATGGYDNPAMGGLLVTTHRVRKSRLLRVTREGERLVIEEVARAQ
jgi:hypothetical protein